MALVLLLYAWFGSSHAAKGQIPNSLPQFVSELSFYFWKPIQLLDFEIVSSDNQMVFYLQVLNIQTDRYKYVSFTESEKACDKFSHLVFIPPYLNEDVKLANLELCSSNIYLLPLLPHQLKPRLDHQVIIYTSRNNGAAIELSETYYIKGTQDSLRKFCFQFVN